MPHPTRYYVDWGRWLCGWPAVVGGLFFLVMFVPGIQTLLHAFSPVGFPQFFQYIDELLPRVAVGLDGEAALISAQCSLNVAGALQDITILMPASSAV